MEKVEREGPLMPKTSSHSQRIERALDVYRESLEGLQNATLEFEAALLEFEETLNEGAQGHPVDQSLRLLSPLEVCQRLGVDTRSVYQLLRSGEIRSVRLGRAIKVRQSDLEGYLAAQRGRSPHEVSLRNGE